MGSIGCYSAGIRARRSFSGKAPSIVVVMYGYESWTVKKAEYVTFVEDDEGGTLQWREAGTAHHIQEVWW